jgi:hypothetical protein
MNAQGNSSDAGASENPLHSPEEAGNPRFRSGNPSTNSFFSSLLADDPAAGPQNVVATAAAHLQTAGAMGYRKLSAKPALGRRTRSRGRWARRGTPRLAVPANISIIPFAGRVPRAQSAGIKGLAVHARQLALQPDLLPTTTTSSITGETPRTSSCSSHGSSCPSDCRG